MPCPLRIVWQVCFWKSALLRQPAITPTVDVLFGPLLCQSTQDVESIAGRAGREEIRNRIFRASRTGEELHWPFRDASFLHMNVLAWIWLGDVFLLQDQSEWLFRAWELLRKPEGVRVGCEYVVVIVSVLFVRCDSLRVAPHTVFQDGVPHKSSPGVTRSGILADSRRIERSRKPCSLLHQALLDDRTGNHTTPEIAASYLR